MADGKLKQGGRKKNELQKKLNNKKQWGVNLQITERLIQF